MKTSSETIRFAVMNPDPREIRALISQGVALPGGFAADAESLALCDAKKSPAPAQVRVLQRDRDGSIRWVRLDFWIELKGGQTTDLELQRGKSPSVAKPAFARAENGQFVIGNEHFSARFDPLDFTPLGEIESYCSRHNRSRLVIDELLQSRNVRIEIVSAGPVCAELRVTGVHTDQNGRRCFDYALSYRVVSEVNALFLDHAFIHTDDDPADQVLHEVRLDFDFDLLSGAQREILQRYADHDGNSRRIRLPQPVGLNFGRVRYHRHCADPTDAMLDDSTPLAWQGSRHPLFDRLAQDVAPHLALRAEKRGVLIRFQNAHAHAPKTLSSEGQTLRAGIWPGWAGELVVPQGFAKTHTLALAFFGEDSSAAEKQLQDFFKPLRLAQSPELFRKEKLLDQHLLLAYAPRQQPYVESMFPILFDLPWPKGFWNHGDTYAGSYEKFYDEIPRGQRVYLNNEYDLLLVLCQEFVRTGKVHYYELAAAMAQHICDIDVFHHATVYPFMRGAMRPHGLGHIEATGIPSHQWVEGLLAFHQLSGTSRALEIAELIGGNWLLWLERRWNSTEPRDQHWALIGLSALHEATGKDIYAEGAQMIFSGMVKISSAWTTAQWNAYPIWGLGLYMAALKRYHQAFDDPQALEWLRRVFDEAKKRLYPRGELSINVDTRLHLRCHEFTATGNSYLDWLQPDRESYLEYAPCLQLAWRGLLSYGTAQPPDGKLTAIGYRSLMYGLGWAERHKALRPFSEIAAGHSGL